MTVFNWLSNMEIVGEPEHANVFEVRFKNGRKEFYRNIDDLSLSIGDLVVVKAERGYDLGHVTLKGGLIQVQMKKKKVDPKKDLLAIVRKATQKDIDLWTQSREKEESIKKRSREMAISLKLKMKISILLPYKENFSPEYPGAVSLFVYETSKISKFKKYINVYGNTNYKKIFNL